MNFATFHNRQPGCTTHAWYAPRDFPPPHPMMWLHKAQQQQQQQKQNNGREEDNGREEQKTRLDSGLRVARSFGRCVARAAALVAACRRPCDGDGPFGCTERHVWTRIARPIFRLWLPTPDTTTPRSLSRERCEMRAHRPVAQRMVARHRKRILWRVPCPVVARRLTSPFSSRAPPAVANPDAVHYYGTVQYYVLPPPRRAARQPRFRPPVLCLPLHHAVCVCRLGCPFERHAHRSDCSSSRTLPPTSHQQQQQLLQRISSCTTHEERPPG